MSCAWDDEVTTMILVSVSRLSQGIFLECLNLFSILSLQCLGLVSHLETLWYRLVYEVGNETIFR